MHGGDGDDVLLGGGGNTAGPCSRSAARSAPTVSELDE
jgi:hypothetical protein